MIITAMYLYGIISNSWEFSWFVGLLAFIMDLAICSRLRPTIIKIENKKKNNFGEYIDYVDV